MLYKTIYYCLRNYYNQAVHDILDRHAASTFLAHWLCEYLPVEMQEAEKINLLEGFSDIGSSSFLLGDAYTSEYSSWEETFSVNGFDVGIGQSWDTAKVLFDALILPDIHINGTVLSPSFAWKKQKILVFDVLNADIQSTLRDSGWLALDIHTDPNQLHGKLQERS